MADSDLFGGTVGVLTRLLRIGRTLAGAHIEVAQAEAARDAARMMEGVLLLAFGLLCLFAAGLMANAAGALALVRYSSLGWPVAVTVVAVIDVVLALSLFSLGRRRLKRPMMKETRGLMRRTVTALSEG